MRPGPSRSWAILKPDWRGASAQGPAGTRHAPDADSQCPGPATWPMLDSGRTRLKPGLSVGTRIIVARLCLGASGSVTAITIATDAPRASVVHHLRPLITHSSPS